MFEQLDLVITAGDEEAARKFLVDHFKEFSPNTQEEITFAFFTRAVNDQTTEIANISDTQKQSGYALRLLLGVQKELENETRIQELQGQLKPKS